MREMRGASSVAALLVLVVGYGAVALSGAQVLRTRIAPRAGLRELAADVAVSAADWGVDWGVFCHDELYRAWSLSLVVDVAYEDRGPRSFGVWPTYDDFYAVAAADDGSITQWSEDYFVTHNWSEYGKQILTLVPGDSVTVGTTTMQVEGLFDYPNEGMLGQIRAIVGEEAVVLQTCEVGRDDVSRIVYGPKM